MLKIMKNARIPYFANGRTDGHTDTRTHALNHEKHFEYMSNHNRAPFGRNKKC